MPTPDDLAAKKDFIEAFFEELEKKAALTDRLFAEGHKDEARLLCCCYIEALGTGLDPSDGSGARNFASILVDHGAEPVLGLIHPKALRNSLPYKSTAPVNKALLETAFQSLPRDQALTSRQLLHHVQHLPSETVDFLKQELWRATIANVAYSQIRSLGAHWFGSPGSVSFSATTFQGKQIPEVDFTMLRRALDRVITFTKDLSLSSNKWFDRF